MRPVFEHAFVDRLRAVKVLAPIGRDARVEDVVVRALDHIDRIDLHISKMFDRETRRFRSFAEGGGRIEALRLDPDAAGI